ncbi:MAG: pyrimidine 5'-nucleotidase [Anaerolineae bacterium]
MTVHYQYLLFDLDETLYTDTSGLFEEVHKRIVRWLSEALDVSPEEAGALRERYYRAYGTTMGGLLRHHPQVDIEAYLEAVHRIEVPRYLSPNPALDAMLSRLPARKAIFTNAITGWAERVLSQLGVRHHFETIIDVRAVGYQSKPRPAAYARALARLGVRGETCVLLDDKKANLEGAAAFGMTTIWVSREAVAGNGVDYVVPTVLEAEPLLHHLLGSTAPPPTDPGDDHER